MLSPENLHDYQWNGAEFLVNTPRSALMAGLGLGKTIMTLTALVELIEFEEVSRVLIIAPKRVAASVWHTEAKNWTHTKDLRISTAVGKPKERRSAILSALAFDHGIVTINPENLGWLINMLESMKISWPFDTIIFDEFSMFKSSDSKRFKNMEGICCDYTQVTKGILREVISPVTRVHGLTATPAASGVENLWSQIKLLDSGQRLGIRVSHFREAFMKNKAPPGVQYQKWEPTKGAAENIYDAVSDIVKVMLPEDHLDMPDLVHNDIVVDIPVSVRRDMKTLEAELMLEIKNEGFSEEIIAANAGALANKLMQFSNGACIAEGTEVLTDCGWLPIEYVNDSMRVWDGVAWVNCAGSKFMGVKPVMEIDGVHLTEDHRILTVSGWVQAGDIIDDKKYNRASTNTRNGAHESLEFMVSNATAMPIEDAQGLSELWRSWDTYMSRMAGQLSKFLQGYGRSSRRNVSGSKGQFRRLSSKQLSMGHSDPAISKSTEYQYDKHPVGDTMSVASSQRVRHQSSNPTSQDTSVREMRARTYDVFNAGPRQRYTIRGADGKELIVHNCYVGDPQDPDYEKQWAQVHDAKLDALAELDETCDYPLLVAYWFQSDLERILKKFPKWEVLSKKAKESADQIERWNAGKIDRLLIHPASAGHGLNLQYGGSTFVLFSMFWSLELYQQLVGRLHRQGQSEAVSVNRIVIRDSIEQRVAMALASRAAVQDDLLEYLNEYGG